MVIFIGCGGYYNPNDYNSSTAPPKYGSDDIYINPLNGNNIDGEGSVEKPYKTINYALSHLKSLTSTLYLSGGDYNLESGETFPIVLPQGINLYQYNDNNFTTNIQGSGYFNDKEVCLVLSGNNKLHHLSISSKEHLGILSLKGTNTILLSTLKNNRTALALLDTSYITLTSVDIEENINGVEINNQSTLKLVSSDIQKNEIGIFVSDQGYIDSRSENSKIIENKKCDFFTDGNRNLFLQGLSWDMNSSDFTIQESCSDGNNIVNHGEGTISFQPTPNNQYIDFPENNRSSEITNPSNDDNNDDNNDTINVNDENSSTPIDETNTTSQNVNNVENSTLLFTVKNEIDILYPPYDASLFSTEPIIKFNKTMTNKYIMVTIWKKLPIIRDNKIQNPKDIFWYWHSGMKGNIGQVDYQDGAEAINGDIQTTSSISPRQLSRGRAYYLAIWEWDREGLTVIASSHVSIFNVK
jgi:hypothetical protein